MLPVQRERRPGKEVPPERARTNQRKKERSARGGIASELLLPGGNWGGGPRKENETKLAVF